MDPHIRHWKVAIERFCAASDPDYREIAKLIAEIAMTDIDETLRHAAAQVLPILRLLLGPEPVKGANGGETA